MLSSSSSDLSSTTSSWFSSTASLVFLFFYCFFVVFFFLMMYFYSGIRSIVVFVGDFLVVDILCFVFDVLVDYFVNVIWCVDIFGFAVWIFTVVFVFSFRIEWCFWSKEILLEVGCLGFSPVLVVSGSWFAAVVMVLAMATAVSVLVSASLALLKLSSSALLVASSSGLLAFASVLVFSGKWTAPSI